MTMKNKIYIIDGKTYLSHINDEVAVFQDVLDLRGGEQVLGVLVAPVGTPPHFLNRFQISAE